MKKSQDAENTGSKVTVFYQHYDLPSLLQFRCLDIWQKKKIKDSIPNNVQVAFISQNHVSLH